MGAGIDETRVDETETMGWSICQDRDKTRLRLDNPQFSRLRTRFDKPQYFKTKTRPKLDCSYYFETEKSKFARKNTRNMAKQCPKSKIYQ